MKFLKTQSKRTRHAALLAACGTAGLLCTAARLHAQDTPTTPNGATPGQVQQGTVPLPQPSRQAGAANGNVNTSPPQDPQQEQAAQASAAASTATEGLFALRGRTITAIRFAGIEYLPTDPLPSELGIQAGDRLDPNKVRSATRRLFLTGFYRDIQVRSVREGDGSRVCLRNA